MDDFALTPAERQLLSALNRHQVRFLVIGMSAALLQGAPVTTQDIDLWIDDLGSAEFRRALADANGFWVPGSGLQPPAMGGEGLERLDVVLTAHGLSDFSTELANAKDYVVDGIPIKVLGLSRIVASKRSTNRPKDRAALPALEAALAASSDAAGT